MLDQTSKDDQVKFSLMTRERTLVTGTLYGVSSVGRSNYTRNDQHQHSVTISVGTMVILREVPDMTNRAVRMDTIMMVMDTMTTVMDTMVMILTRVMIILGRMMMMVGGVVMRMMWSRMTSSRVTIVLLWNVFCPRHPQPPTHLYGICKPHSVALVLTSSQDMLSFITCFSSNCDFVA